MRYDRIWNPERRQMRPVKSANAGAFRLLLTRRRLSLHLFLHHRAGHFVRPSPVENCPLAHAVEPDTWARITITAAHWDQAHMHPAPTAGHQQVSGHQITFARHCERMEWILASVLTGEPDLLRGNRARSSGNTVGVSQCRSSN